MESKGGTQGLRRALGWLVVLLLLATLALYVLGRPRVRAVSIERIHAETGVPVEVAPAVRAEFVDYVYCDGTVVAETRTILRAKVEEIVEAVHVRVGEPVEQGQLLVEFRSTDLQEALAAAEAVYREAESSYHRYKGLYEQQVISKERLEQVQTALESAQAALQTARSRMEFTKIRAPFSGIVEDRWVEPGELKSVGRELLSIVDLSKLEVRALVPQRDVPALLLAQEGEFQLESSDEWTKGPITRVAPSTSDPTRFFDAYLKVENRRVGQQWLIRPGMYAQVRFVRAARKGVVAVPEAAVKIEADRPVVYALKHSREKVSTTGVEAFVQAPPARGFAGRVAAGLARVSQWVSASQPKGNPAPQVREMEAEVTRAQRLEVTVGMHGGGLVELVGAPLGEGEMVIVNPAQKVRDGTLVRVMGTGE